MNCNNCSYHKNGYCTKKRCAYRKKDYYCMIYGHKCPIDENKKCPICNNYFYYMIGYTFEKHKNRCDHTLQDIKKYKQKIKV